MVRTYGAVVDSRIYHHREKHTAVGSEFYTDGVVDIGDVVYLISCIL